MNWYIIHIFFDSIPGPDHIFHRIQYLKKYIEFHIPEIQDYIIEEINHQIDYKFLVKKT